jgi:hypothetical protein
MAHQAFIQTADERIEAETASLEFTEDTEKPSTARQSIGYQ